MSLANMMAMQVENEELERRGQRSQPRAASGTHDDVEEGEEDQEIDGDDGEAGEEQEAEEDDEEGQEDEETNEAPTPEEVTDDEIDQCGPEETVDSKPAHDEGSLNALAAKEDILPYRARPLGIGERGVQQIAETRDDVMGSAGTAAAQHGEEDEVYDKSGGQRGNRKHEIED